MRELVLDVSRWDAGIDLQAWRDAHDLWGVIVKATGSDQGRYVDSQFAANYDKAIAAGLHVGAYCYSAATDTDEARQDARHMLQAMGGRSFDLPIYIDVEEQSQARLGKRALTDVVLAFIDEVENAGHIGGVYTSGSWWQNNVYADELRPYANWIAWWTSSKPNAIADVGLWQFGSMRLSDGDIQHDDVSGYVDANWCYVDYPTQGKGRGGSVARVSIADKAATIHYDMVTDPRNGYTQGDDRWGGNYGGTKTVSGNNWAATYALGDRDCASSVIVAWQLALQGTAYEGALDGATYTGDIEEVFVSSGLFYSQLSPAKRGDLYLTARTPYRLGHVAMCQDGGSDGMFGYDCLSEFVRNENGGAFGGEPGDQDEGESIFRDYYDYQGGWQTVLHYNGKADYTVEDAPKPAPKPHQEPGKPKNDFGLGYQAHVQDIGWNPEVRDGQTAGTVGYGKRLEAIRFTTIPAGWSISAKAHIANIGWRDFGTVKAGDIIGSTGKGNAIENLMLDAVTPSGDTRKLHYQVHQENVGWKGVTSEGFASGTDGMGLRLEAVRIWLS